MRSLLASRAAGAPRPLVWGGDLNVAAAWVEQQAQKASRVPPQLAGLASCGWCSTHMLRRCGLGKRFQAAQGPKGSCGAAVGPRPKLPIMRLPTPRRMSDRTPSGSAANAGRTPGTRHMHIP